MSCTHENIGLPGCPTCDPDRGRVVAALRAQVSALRARVAELEVALRAEQTENYALAARAQRAEAERDAARAEVERLTAPATEATTLRREFADWAGIGVESGALPVVVMATLRKLKTERDDARKALADLQGDDDAWRRTYESTHAELLKERTEVERLTREVVATGDAGELAVAVAKRWKAAAERERADNERLREALNERARAAHGHLHDGETRFDDCDEPGCVKARAALAGKETP